MGHEVPGRELRPGGKETVEGSPFTSCVTMRVTLPFWAPVSVLGRKETVAILSSWVIKIIWIKLQNLPGSPGPWRGTYLRAPTTNSTVVTAPLVGFGMGSQRWTSESQQGP